MKHSGFATIGSPAIRSHHSFGMASCAVPSILMLLLSLSFAAGRVWAQCGSLSAPSTTWSDGNGSWGVAGNWTSGAPNASTNACILDGTSIVTLETIENAAAVQLSSGNSLNINAGGSLTYSNSSLNGCPTDFVFAHCCGILPHAMTKHTRPSTRLHHWVVVNHTTDC